MTDYMSFVPGTTNYTSSSNFGGNIQSYDNFGGFGNFGQGGRTEEVTTTTMTTRPVVNTEVIEQGIESAFGSNTAEGYFGGAQANVSNINNQTANFNAFNQFQGDGFFGGGASQVITTVEQQVTAPQTSYTTTQTTYTPPPPPPPAPAPVTTYNAYQDYNTNYDYTEEVPKKKSICNLRNILLGCAGLLLLGGLLGGLLALLRHLFKSKNKAAIPSYIIPQPTPLTPDINLIQPNIVQPPIVQPPIVQPPIVQPTFNPEPVQPFLQPIQPGFQNYSADKLNAALLAALAAGALPAAGIAGYNALNQNQNLNQGQIGTAQGSFGFTPADIPQLLALRKVEGKFTPKTLAKLGMTEEQYRVLLGNAYSSGLVNKKQLELLALNGKIAPYLNLDAEDQTIAPAPAVLNPNVFGNLNAFSPADIQQLLGIADRNGKFKAKSLGKFGMKEPQFLSMLTNSYRNGIVSEKQLSDLGVGINENGELGFNGSAGFGFRNKLSRAWNTLLGRNGVSTTNNIMQTLSNTSLPRVNPSGLITY